MLHDEAVTVKLVGGIGNQLFGYFAGLSLAQKRGVGLRLDVSDLHLEHAVHRSNIQALNLPGEFYVRNSNSSFINQTYERSKSWIKRRLPSLNYFSDQYVSPVVGYDASILDQNFKKRNIAGYFQSYKYHELCLIESREWELRNPSSWFTQMRRTIESTNVISIHIRRGDYKNLKTTFGLLSKDYYSRAIKIATDFVPNAEFWVFTDDISDARSMLNGFVGNIVFIEPPLSSDPVESLLLMSYSKANIIANSTFSWWSARLNKQGKIVVAPRKWFYEMEDPLFLYPTSWALVESSWITS